MVDLRGVPLPVSTLWAGDSLVNRRTYTLARGSVFGAYFTPFLIHEGPRRAAKDHEEHLLWSPPQIVVSEREHQGRIGPLLHADALHYSHSVSSSPSVNDHKFPFYTVLSETTEQRTSATIETIWRHRCFYE